MSGHFYQINRNIMANTWRKSVHNYSFFNLIRPTSRPPFQILVDYERNRIGILYSKTRYFLSFVFLTRFF